MTFSGSSQRGRQHPCSQLFAGSLCAVRKVYLARRGVWALAGVLGAAVPLAGCVRSPLATADGLPLARVVLYRNGVGYFEREGHVAGDEVRFRMKSEEVGDFLATLAVMESGGSSVRAAAFPLPEPEPKAADAGAPPKEALRTVALALDGRAHDLRVGYVAESPVWRPSYRVVLGADTLDLQAWGIVHNLSGEDWKGVKLTLVAGAPVAFQAELGTPVIPTRPTVTDEGEVIAVVPHAETSLNQAPADEAEAPKAAPEPPPAAPSAAVTSAALDAKREPRTLALAPSRKLAPAAEAPARAYGYSALDDAPLTAAPRSVHSLAAVAVESGSTRYDLPLPVTVPDRSATMVLLLSRRVAGASLFLFAPDPGVSESASHPFRVVRFKNDLAGTLERGPIAIFDGQSFLGQGIVDPVPAGATATVPFALERGIGIDQDRDFDDVGGRIAKIANGKLVVEHEAATRTHYHLRSGRDEVTSLFVKHPRLAGSHLFSPPSGTEDNVGTGSALVPAKVPSRATVDLVVDERVTEKTPSDWYSPLADRAVSAYLADAKSDAAVVKALTAAWPLRKTIADSTEERRKLQSQSATLERSTEETRRNLKAIEKNKSADALRQRLVARLADAATHLDEINRRVVELDAKIAEFTVRFEDAVQSLQVGE